MSDQQGTQDPQLLLGQLLFGKQMTYCLSGVARLGVADHMNTTPMAVEEIAGKTGAHAGLESAFNFRFGSFVEIR